jgi:hypothetical protein
MDYDALGLWIRISHWKLPIRQAVEFRRVQDMVGHIATGVVDLPSHEIPLSSIPSHHVDPAPDFYRRIRYASAETSVPMRPRHFDVHSRGRGDRRTI